MLRVRTKTEDESLWVDYAMMSGRVLNIIGALSVAIGMWWMMKWLISGTRASQGQADQGTAQEVQTEESDDSNIVYKLYQRIEHLHDQKSLLKKQEGQQSRSMRPWRVT